MAWRGQEPIPPSYELSPLKQVWTPDTITDEYDNTDPWTPAAGEGAAYLDSDSASGSTDFAVDEANPVRWDLLESDPPMLSAEACHLESVPAQMDTSPMLPPSRPHEAPGIEGHAPTTTTGKRKTPVEDEQDEPEGPSKKRRLSSPSKRHLSPQFKTGEAVNPYVSPPSSITKAGPPTTTAGKRQPLDEGELDEAEGPSKKTRLSPQSSRDEAVNPYVSPPRSITKVGPPTPHSPRLDCTQASNKRKASEALDETPTKKQRVFLEEHVPKEQALSPLPSQPTHSHPKPHPEPHLESHPHQRDSTPPPKKRKATEDLNENPAKRQRDSQFVEQITLPKVENSHSETKPECLVNSISPLGSSTLATQNPEQEVESALSETKSECLLNSISPTNSSTLDKQNPATKPEGLIDTISSLDSSTLDKQDPEQEVGPAPSETKPEALVDTTLEKQDTEQAVISASSQTKLECLVDTNPSLDSSTLDKQDPEQAVESAPSETKPQSVVDTISSLDGSTLDKQNVDQSVDKLSLPALTGPVTDQSPAGSSSTNIHQPDPSLTTNHVLPIKPSSDQFCAHQQIDRAAPSLTWFRPGWSCNMH